MRTGMEHHLKRFVLVSSFILAFILYENAGYSQVKRFQITGMVKGIDTGLIKINFLFSDSMFKYSYIAKIDHGKFSIGGEIPHPMRGYWTLNSSFTSDDCIIMPGKQKVYFDATSQKNFYQSIKITGSSVNDEFVNGYQKQLQPFYDELDNCYDLLDSLNKLFVNEKPAAIYAEPIKRFELAIRKIDSVKKTYIINHTSSYVSLWTLYTNIWSIDNLEFVAEAFNYLNEKVRNCVVGKKLAERIETQKAFLNERIFPSMMVADSNEKKVKFPEIIKGKYTLIDLWFSHCRPCIAQFPVIKNLYAKYKDAGFDVISISVDKKDKKNDWLDAIRRFKLDWMQYWDVDGKVENNYLIDSYPTNFLLDSEGKIIRKKILLEELDIFLAKNLK